MSIFQFFCFSFKPTAYNSILLLFLSVKFPTLTVESVFFSENLEIIRNGAPSIGSKNNNSANIPVDGS